MYIRLRQRVTVLWLIMLIATCFSWEAAAGLTWSRDLRLGTTVVMTIAFAKARFILLDFMELRTAPLALRIMSEAWIALVWAGILMLYVLGAPF